MIHHLHATVGVGDKADAFALSYEKRLTDKPNEKKLGGRPRVYFQEWGVPMIAGITWIPELVEIEGGTDGPSGLSYNSAATDRTVTN